MTNNNINTVANTAISIPKLTDNNWRYWERVIRTVLEGREFWDVVTKDTPQPNDKDWSKKNNTAMSILLTSLEEDQLPYLGDTDVAKEAWKNLTDARAPKTAQSQLNHLSTLLTMRPTSAENITKFANQFNQEFLALKEAGVALPELVGIGILMHKLPKPYETLLQTLIITNTSLTVKGTINYISTEEQRQAHHKEDADGHMHMEMANFSKSTSSAIRKPCDHSRHSGGADNCWQLHPELQKKRGNYNNKRGPFNSSSHQSNLAICDNWSH